MQTPTALPTSSPNAAPPTLVPVWQYNLVEDYGMHFYFSTNPDLPSDGWSQYNPNEGNGWTRDDTAFYAYKEPTPDTVPVYQYHMDDESGWRSRFSTDPNVGQGWTRDDAAFYAYSKPTPETVPVYQYQHVEGWRFLLSTDPNVGDGWTHEGPVFHTVQNNVANE